MPEIKGMPCLLLGQRTGRVLSEWKLFYSKRSNLRF
ncbi:Uncharacterised protein [Vibrio cholerae]|nr:Uncharacterised protein [Vibrio cholerae]